MAIVAMFSMVIFTVYGNNGFAEFNKMKQSRNTIIKKNEELIQKNLTMYHTIERLRKDKAFIENVARNDLGVVGKNELIFQMPKIDPKKGLEQ
jgi:cell division protein FtsB